MKDVHSNLEEFNRIVASRKSKNVIVVVHPLILMN